MRSIHVTHTMNLTKYGRLLTCPAFRTFHARYALYIMYVRREYLEDLTLLYVIFTHTRALRAEAKSGRP